jgi:glucuronoarabinoxylan endo-1,4-beta-xylanase
LVVAPEPAVEPIDEVLDPNAPEVKATVSVNLEQRQQTLEGFGAAVAWHQGRLVDNVSDEVYQLLFPDLGLDILRFRNRFERSDPTDRNLGEEVEIFERATQALGHAPVVMLSSWSPPAALKANGKERCNNNDNCTLLKRDGRFVYDEFADWWLRSLQHYASLGIMPTFVSVQNEPDFIPGNWEGCKFTPDESSQYPAYGKALSAVHARLASLAQRPRLLGPEVLGIHYQRVPKYLQALDTTLLYGVSHHIYERGNDNMWDWRSPGPDSFLDEMEEVRASTSLPTFQTEFNTDEDHGVDGGFETAWLIHHTMVTQGAAAFLYWDLIWSGNKGLVSLVGLTAKPRDHYYALRHFSRFTDPGFTRVSASSDTPTVLSSAYVSPDAAQLTAVLLNSGNGIAQVDLLYPKHFTTAEQSVVTTFRPGKSHRWVATPVEVNDETDQSRLTLRLPARSVATIVLSR